MAAPRTSACALREQVEHRRPGRRIAPLGQGGQQSDLGLGLKFRQCGGEAPRGLGALGFLADLLQADGPHVLVLVGNKVDHRLHQIVIGADAAKAALPRKR